MTVEYLIARIRENDAPKTGLTPAITIKKLKIVSPYYDYAELKDGTSINADTMHELGNGEYIYIFDNYDQREQYTVYVDAGASIPANRERYQWGDMDFYKQSG